MRSQARAHSRAGIHAVDERHRHRGGDFGRHAGQACAAEDDRLRIEAHGRLAAGFGQQRVGAVRVGGELRAGRCDGMDARERCRKARATRPAVPASAASGSPPVTTAKRPYLVADAKRRFREPADRHARAIAHREQAGVAEAADQHRVGPLAVRMRDGPRIERRVLRDRVAGLAGDVRRAEARGDRVNVERVAGLRAQMALQQLADRSRRCWG